MNIKSVLFNKFTLLLVILALAGAGGWFGWQKYHQASEVKYRTAEAKNGDLTQSVSANGTLKPVVLVNVGTQVSGTVNKLHVDFNDQVKAGQVLLELDPAVLNAQVEQTTASLANARASLDLALANENRAKTLFQQEYISRQEFDQATQQARSARAQVEQVNAQLGRDKTNQAYTIIRSPVSGVVVSRNVDIGQTVAASFQTPTLFQIAQDLRKMQIDTAFAEADIGSIKVGQPVQFTVDAFPNRNFTASVRQVRLNATTTQNVVTYNVVVAVDNPEALLLPSMTAYVGVITAQRSDVLLIPNAALRFRPPDAPGTPPPARRERAAKGEATEGGGAPGGSAASGSSAEAGEPGTEKAAKRRRPPVEGGGTASDGERRLAGKGTRAAGDAAGADAKGAGKGQRQRPGQAVSSEGPRMESRGVVYVLENKQLRRVPVRVGISDGRFSELVGGDIKPGAKIVTGVEDNSAPSGPAQGTFRMRLF